MSEPIEVDLPHQLGRTEARRRIADNVGKLDKHLPAGSQAASHHWDGDTLHLSLKAMGQEIAAQIAVGDSVVKCRVALPGMLAFFARPIAAAISAKGNDLLLEDKRA